MKRRAKPGTTGKGKFFRIEVRPKEGFKSFRVHDVGSEGHLERLAGRRSSGSWDTVSWLVSKDDAHVESGRLIITNKKVKESVAKGTSGRITHVKADIFHAHPKKKKSIKKAQSSKSKRKHKES